MTEMGTRDVWVWIEIREDGSVREGLGLLRLGRSLADRLGGRLTAVVIGGRTDAAAGEAARHDVDQVVAADIPEHSGCDMDALVDAMCRLAEKYAPAVLLIGGTPNGRELAPRLGCRLGAGVIADCTDVAVGGNSGDIVWTHPILGGRMMAEALCTGGLQIGTVRPGVFKPASPAASHALMIQENLPVPSRRNRTELLRVIQDTAEELVDLEGADIIVSGGRGLGGPEGFALVRDLADTLGAAVGASRAAVDAGWIGHAHQVGQTGRTVEPRVYIACGISGAIQHQAGMSRSECIVAVNQDPDAPIFEISRYGVVGDLFEILPLLTHEVKRRKGLPV